MKRFLSRFHTPQEPAPKKTSRRAHRAPVPRPWNERLLHHAKWIAKFPTTLTALAAIIAIGGGVYHYATSSPFFEVDSVTIRSGKRISESQIRDYLHYQCGISPGVSLLSVDEETLADSLQTFPEIARVSIRKEWPNALTVSVHERNAVGIFVSSTGSYVFDEEGLLFSRARAQDYRDLDGPPITGLPNVQLEIGLSIPKRELDFARKYENVWRKASPDLFAQLSEFHLDDAGLTLALENGERFFCGTRPPEQTGPVVESLMTAQNGVQTIAFANLVAENHITMTRTTRRTYHVIPSIVAQTE